MQTLSLTKGEKIDLTKANPTLKVLNIGLGWDASQAAGKAYDLDVYAAGTDANGKVISGTNFIYFNNKKNANDSIVHSGDNLTGEGAGDDETIKIVLSDVPTDVEAIEIGVFIYDAIARGNQNFGQVKNAYARAVDADTNAELTRYDLSEEYSGQTAIKVARIYRHNGEWKFEAKGEGFKGQITDIVNSYGL